MNLSEEALEQIVTALRAGTSPSGEKLQVKPTVLYVGKDQYRTARWLMYLYLGMQKPGSVGVI